MDENQVIELLNYLRSQPEDIEIILPRLDQYDQAIVWAQSLQRWDLIVELTKILSHQLEFSHRLNAFFEEQGAEKHISEKLRYCWEWAKRFAEQGLKAAKQLDDQKQLLEFLAVLSRLSSRLNDVKATFNYLSQELNLTEPSISEAMGREFYLLGNKASELKDYLTARKCYQISLGIYQKFNSIHAVVNLIPFLVINETKRIDHEEALSEQDKYELQTIIEGLWQLHDAFQRENETTQLSKKEISLISDKSSDKSSIDLLYEHLQATITRLDASP